MHKSQEFLHFGNAVFYRYNRKVIFVIKNTKKLTNTQICVERLLIGARRSARPKKNFSDQMQQLTLKNGKRILTLRLNFEQNYLNKNKLYRHKMKYIRPRTLIPIY